MIPDARTSNDGLTVRCNWGQQQCGGVLGYWSSPWKEPFYRPAHIVPSQDADGVLYEEPEKRRWRRMRGQHSEHHLSYPALGDLPSRAQGRNRPDGESPKAIRQETPLPARIRCPQCKGRRFNWVRAPAHP